MSEWIGHSMVAAVAAMIILSATVTKTRVESMVVATIKARAGKKMMLDVAAGLERDLRNMGSNFPAYELEPDSTSIQWETDSTINFFQFVGQVEPGQPPAIIRYEWQVVDSTTVGDELKPTYQIARYLNGTLSRVTASVFTGVSFKIENDMGGPAATPDEVRQIAIELIGISGVGSSTALMETRWNAVYRPEALAREDANDL
ncbi:MAG: hypothetical protein WBW88_17990 [Rhodothermales bacterium]